MKRINVGVVALVDLGAMGKHADMVPASSSLHVDVREPLHVLRKLVVLISLHAGHVYASPPFCACESTLVSAGLYAIAQRILTLTNGACQGNGARRGLSEAFGRRLVLPKHVGWRTNLRDLYAIEPPRTSLARLGSAAGAARQPA